MDDLWFRFRGRTGRAASSGAYHAPTERNQSVRCFSSPTAQLLSFHTD